MPKHKKPTPITETAEAVSVSKPIEPLFPGRYSDTERLAKLEEMLRSDGRVCEFWFDDDTHIWFAGDFGGDNLRAALDDLLDSDQVTR